MIKKIIFALFLILLSSCADNKEEKEKNPEPPKSIKLVFTGDIMTHPTIVNAFESNDVLIDLKDYFQGDIVFANLEFVVNTNKPPMPYPEFNGSLDYLKYFFNYFNTFSIANNHAYDQGAQAEAETVAELHRNNKLTLGGSTNSPSISPIITNINNIPLFISAYTMLDNGLSHKTNKNGHFYFMNFFPKQEDLLEKVKSDLALATNNEIKIISLHFGLEYTTYPEEKTIETARALIENGVDIIVGHHPHVPRPVEIYEGTNHSGIIIYSLGNFIANHKGRYPHLDIGTVVSLKINENKEINFSYVPTYYAFFKQNGFEVIMKPIKEDPNINMPALASNYVYSTYDTNAIKKGYELIHNFYSPLTNDKVKTMFAYNITNISIISNNSLAHN
ncbi:poly-gamma-glutamate biosynthesis-like protein [Brachyspira hampsonii 30446]|uniref:Poly-gamma-glutamate biosynthesis-like protein n=1 Tax=Brachyspira hampsonii 30446 TaxID=1289135 RepID=A0A2U4FAR8_9SPIR|nr:CapA family protein [Brachyspira hampsonii]EKV56444.1 poly-gamma-glutamate biosynthesis-like protein [Brachyspira hampsonii 30446]MBW5394167.1 CapA family protein [Brachyspira hampsonii]OEJ20110.1 poly-gamma-glutamate biosynthesis protein [Brachyspira hampsonii]